MSDVNAALHDTLLYLDGVTVSFDGFRALNALSLVLEAGEMRAVIGPNGAGKTTMMDVITGRTRPDAGTVVFGKDIDLTRLDEPAIASLGIGRKFQKPTVFEPHTVWDNLLLSLAEDRRPRFTLWARETGAERERIEEILLTTRLIDQTRGEQDLLDALAFRRGLARPERETRPAVFGERQQQIVPYRMGLEHRRLLELPPDAQ